MDVSANGNRVRFTRDVAAIAMDLDDVESIAVKVFGGADNLVVNDLSGTDVTNVVFDLAALGGSDDGQPDNVITHGTNGDDVVSVAGTDPTRRPAACRLWSRSRRARCCSRSTVARA